MRTTANVTDQRRAAADGSKQVDQVDAARATGVRGNGHTRSSEPLQLMHELGIEAISEKITWSFLEHGEQEGAIDERHCRRTVRRMSGGAAIRGVYERFGFGQVSESAQLFDGA